MIRVEKPQWRGQLTCECCGEIPREDLVALVDHGGMVCRSCLVQAIEAIDKAELQQRANE